MFGKMTDWVARTNVWSARCAALMVGGLCAMMLPAATVTEAEGVLTIDVAANSSYTFTTAQIDDFKTNKWHEIRKTGLGVLVAPINTFTTDFTGTVRVIEGVYQANFASSFPNNKQARFCVEGDSSGGGTLYVSRFSLPVATVMELSGVGTPDANGKPRGAIQTYKKDGDASGTDTTLNNIKLVADAFIRADNSILAYNTFDMQGHTLTLDSNGGFTLYNVVKNPGHFVVENGSMRPGYHAKHLYNQLQGTNVTITLHNAAAVNLYKWNCRINWTIIADRKPGSTQSIFSNFGNGNEPFTWEGPIYLKNADTTNMVSSSSFLSELDICLQLRGPIYGPGALRVNKDGILRLAGTNTFTGGLVLDNNSAMRTVFEGPHALPNGSLDSVTLGANHRVNAALRTAENPGGFTSADYQYFATNCLARMGNGRIWGALTFEGETPDSGADELDGDIYTSSNPFYLRGSELGQLSKLCYSFTNFPRLAARAETTGSGGVKLATPNAAGGEVNGLTLDWGRLALEDAGLIVATNGSTVTAAAGDFSFQKFPRFIVGRNSAWGQTAQVNSGVPTTLTIGSSSAVNSGGIVEVQEGGAITNWTRMGSGGTLSDSAIYVRSGGTLYNTGRSGYDTQLGTANRNLAYIENVGEFVNRSCFIMGSYASAICNMCLKGGETKFVDSDGPHIGREGTGIVYQCGGTLSCVGNALVGSSNYRVPETFTPGGHAAWTLEGAMTLGDVANTTYLCGRGFGTSFLNVNDGATLATKGVRKMLAQISNGKDNGYHVLSNCAGYVSFDGGVLRAKAAGALLGRTNEVYQWKAPGGAWIKETGDSRPDRVSVQQGGLVVDSAGFDVSIDAPLLQPAGGGIAAITLPEGTNLVDYLAAPAVRILGDGTGATAVALFDSATGEVTGVKVTSPGWGYTQEGTQVVLLYGKPGVQEVEARCTVGDPVTTGGLVKRGAGMLTLTAANTYGGETRVEGGVLCLGAAGALPVDSELVVAGGAVTVANGVPFPSTLKLGLDLEHLDERVKYLLAEFPEGTVPAVPQIEGRGDLPPNWDVDLLGRKLFLYRIKGMKLYLR